MLLTKSQLKQITGEIWANGSDYFINHEDILKTLQKALSKVGKNLRDTIFLDLDDDDAEQIRQIKRMLNI